MNTLIIPTQEDFKTWIKEAVKECLEDMRVKQQASELQNEEFLNRKEIAKKLRISLVRLTDWVKKGLPSHKFRGRVYFLYTEVIDHIKKNKLHEFRYM